MKNKIIISFLLIISNCFSQETKFSIFGVVKSNQNLPLELATISISNTDNKTQNTVSDKNGKFQFLNVASGKYILVASLIGFKPYSSKIELTTSDLNLGHLTLTSVTNSLDEVVVTTKSKPMIERKPGITVYNIASDPMSTGKSLSDVALNLPGVSLDNNENLLVNGNGRVMVLINGRKSNINNADLMRQYQPENVERIELITGADPRFASQEGAAVFNIVLKKNRKKDLTGNASMTINNFGFLNASVNASKFSGKTNIFATLSSDDRFFLMKNSVSTKNRFTNQNILQSKTRNNLHHSLRNLVYGVDFYADSLNVITFEHNVSFHKDEMNATIERDFFNGSPISKATIESVPGEWENIFSINHLHNFKNSKKAIETEITGNFFNLNNKRIVATISPETTTISSSAFRIRSEYSSTINSKDSYTIGIDLSLINLNNQSFQSNQTSDLNYKNSKLAIFGFYSYKLNEKWRFRPGLRIEKSNTEAKEINTESTKFDYTSFYPSINILCDVNEKTSFGLDYIRKIDYPELGQFYTYLNQPDDFNLYLGNPNLLPSINNEFNLSFNFKSKFIKWNVSSYFNFVNDIMSEVSEFKSNGQTIRFTDNVGSEKSYGGSFSATIDFNKKWKTTLGTNLNFSDLKLKQTVFAENKNLYNLSYSITNRYILNQKIDMELGFRLMNIYQNINEKSIEPTKNLTFQCNYKANDSWVFAIRANDILGIVKFKNYRYPNASIIIEEENQPRIQFVQITAKYKFGANKKNREKKLEDDKIKFLKE